MKLYRMIAFLLVILALVGVLTPPVAACNIDATVGVVTVEPLPNGDRIETELITYARPDGAKATASGQKTKSYKNSSGVVLWSVTVYGSFTYTGSSATCTSATRSTACPSSAWSIVSSSSMRSGNTATATARAKHTDSNGNVSYTTLTVSLSCSASGTLS